MPLKLHVEVVRKPESNINSKTLCTNVKNELKSKESLTTGRKLTEFGENLSEHVEEINICELEVFDDNDLVLSGVDQVNETVNVSDVSFCLHMFRLSRDIAHTEMMEGGGDGIDMVAAQYWTLPNQEFHSIWDSLIFDTNIKEQLLQYCWTMAEYSEAGVNNNLVSCNRVILLHGPPGTGKTSLCKALASKLAVRMAPVYDNTLLVEVNTHSLFSKYFSESGKLVTRLFEKINEIVSETKTLVCVLIDEVESLAHSRAAAANRTEPSDSFRVVNAVLTQLDLLKAKPNVLVLTTSNMTGAIDVAFVDRADIKKLIPEPSPIVIYTIYYSCIEELMRVGMVVGHLPKRLRTLDGFKPSNISNDDSQDLLVQISMESIGLSGRSLRKVPLLAHAYYLSVTRVTSLSRFIRAMMKVIQGHKEDLEMMTKAG